MFDRCHRFTNDPVLFKRTHTRDGIFWKYLHSVDTCFFDTCFFDTCFFDTWFNNLFRLHHRPVHQHPERSHQNHRSRNGAPGQHAATVAAVSAAEHAVPEPRDFDAVSRYCQGIVSCCRFLFFCFRVYFFVFFFSCFFSTTCFMFLTDFFWPFFVGNGGDRCCLTVARSLHGSRHCPVRRTGGAAASHGQARRCVETVCARHGRTGNGQKVLRPSVSRQWWEGRFPRVSCGNLR